MSRWIELFGSPVATAETIIDKGLLYDLLDQCDLCPNLRDECYDVNAKCAMDSFEAVLEWLNEDVSG